MYLYVFVLFEFGDWIPWKWPPSHQTSGPVVAPLPLIKINLLLYFCLDKLAHHIIVLNNHHIISTYCHTTHIAGPLESHRFCAPSADYLCSSISVFNMSIKHRMKELTFCIMGNSRQFKTVCCAAGFNAWKEPFKPDWAHTQNERKIQNSWCNPHLRHCRAMSSAE